MDKERNCKMYPTFLKQLDFLRREGQCQKLNLIDGSIAMGQIIGIDSDYITLQSDPVDSEGKHLLDVTHYIHIPISNILCVTESTVAWC